MGDRDSRMRFARELSAYVRRRAHELSPELRERAVADPFALYAAAGEEGRAMLESGPRAMNFLSEKSRAHFRELLEHLEQLGLPYELDDMLVGDEREPRVIFAIDSAQDRHRCGHFGRALRRPCPQAHQPQGLLGVSAKGASRRRAYARGGRRQAAALFCPAGAARQAPLAGGERHIARGQNPWLQSFDSSKLSPQLQAATAAGVSHLIIMGQREALDGTVIVRSADNSAQTTLGLAQLPRYLKTLH